MNYELIGDIHEKKEVPTSKKVPFKISDSVLLFIIPVYLYLLSFAFEIGYADYFTIPSDLVKVKLSNYSSTISIVILGLILITGIVLASNNFIKKSYSDNKFSIKKKLWFGIFVRSMIFAFLLIIHYHENQSIVDLVAFSMVFILFILLLTYLDYSYISNKQLYITLPITQEQYFFYSTLLKFIIVSTMSIYDYGFSIARNKENFRTYNDSKEVIIAIYDNIAIVKSKVDLTTRKPTIKIVQLSTLDEEELTYTIIKK